MTNIPKDIHYMHDQISKSTSKTKMSRDNLVKLKGIIDQHTLLMFVWTLALGEVSVFFTSSFGWAVFGLA